MASDRDTNEARQLADRLRGLDQKTLSAARDAGRQVAGQVGKVQSVSQSGGPTATPNVARDQGAPSSAARFRHIQEKDQQQAIGGSRGQQPAQAAAGLQQTAKAPPTASVGQNKNLAEIARSLRESGVSNSRPANGIARPTQQQEMSQQQARGRGR